MKKSSLKMVRLAGGCASCIDETRCNRCMPGFYLDINLNACIPCF